MIASPIALRRLYLIFRRLVVLLVFLGAAAQGGLAQRLHRPGRGRSAVGRAREALQPDRQTVSLDLHPRDLRDLLERISRQEQQQDAAELGAAA